MQTGRGNSAFDLVLRRAIAADADAISALLRASFAEFESFYTPAAFVATVLPVSGVLARLSEGPVWVAETSANQIVGTAGAIASLSVVTIRGMAVAPSARGLGISRRLIEEAERFAHEQGAHTLDLYTTAFLAAAIRLYQSAGFAFTEESISPNGTELLRMMRTLGR
jgi:GNAT superfamily N-acetyltransferase